MKSLFLVATMVGCALAEGPSLAVYKRLSQDDLVTGKNATVTVTIFNKGTAAAFDVELDDTQWGNEQAGTKKSWANILADESVSTTYIVAPGDAGSVLSVEPAKVTYSETKGAESVKVAFSNHVYDISSGVDGITILSQGEYDKKASFRLKEWITFLLLLVIPVFMPLYFHQQSSNTLAARKAAEVTKPDGATNKKSSPGKKSTPRSPKKSPARTR